MTSCLWIPTKLNQTKASGFSAMTTGPIALQSPSWHYWGMHELCFGFFIIILKINLLLVTKIKKFISESCYFYCLNNIVQTKAEAGVSHKNKRRIKKKKGSLTNMTEVVDVINSCNNNQPLFKQIWFPLVEKLTSIIQGKYILARFVFRILHLTKSSLS